ncbi:MAG: MFS transporter [candidate division WOR-3 bacterium]
MKKWLNRNTFFLGLTSLLNDIASEIVHPLLPVFIAETLKQGAKGLGIVEGIAEFTSSTFKLISGYFSDKLKERKKVTVSGYLIAAISRPLLGFANNIFYVILLRFFDRTGKGIRSAPRDALIALSVSKEHSGKAFSFQRAMDHLGAFIGPLFALLLITHFSIREIFYFSLIPGLLAVLSISIFVKEEKKENLILKKESFSFYFKLPFKYYFFLFVFFIFTISNSSDTFIILKAKKEGLILASLPLLWSVFNLIKSLSSMPAGFLADRFGKKRILFLGWLIYSLSYLGFAFAKDLKTFLFLFMFYGIYYGFTEGIERAIISDFLPEDKKGTGFGLFYFLQGIGLLIASFIFGIFWETFGLKIPFLIGSFLSLLAGFLLIFV